MHLDFLDGYRGSLAYWVFVSHATHLGRLDGDYRYFQSTGYFIGVVGFFLLSSYLLTYRLLEELKEIDDNNLQILLTIIKYFIRRFFRIYIPYVFICMLIKHVSLYIGSTLFNWNKISFAQFLSLSPTELSHLWTIPPEIKYYFFIPVLVLITSKLPKKHHSIKFLWVIFLVCLLSIIQMLNLFNIQLEGGNFPYRIWASFFTRFTTFFLGSLLALIIQLIHNLNMYKNYKDNKFFGFFFGTISMILYLIGMILCSQIYVPSLSDKYFFRVSVYWSLFLFAFILGGRNYFTDVFNSKLFYFGGKFSFGIYLYHMGVIDFFFRYYKKTVKLQFEIIIYSIICTFSIGFLHYYLVEKKLIQLASFMCKFVGDMKIFKVSNSLNETC